MDDVIEHLKQAPGGEIKVRSFFHPFVTEQWKLLTSFSHLLARQVV
jgi:hypothetical protein